MKDKKKTNPSKGGSLIIKLLILSGVLMAMLIPQVKLTSVIRERESLQRSAQLEVSQKWGNQQTISGPYLVVPFTEKRISDEDKTYEVQRTLTLMPESLDYSGVLTDNIRKRGIYEVLLYEADIGITGTIDLKHLVQYTREDRIFHWSDAQLQLRIADPMGILSDIGLTWDGDNTLPAEPGILSTEHGVTGVHFDLPVPESKQLVEFSCDLKIRGSQSLFFSPTGRQTNVKLESRWPHPKFTGNKLPDAREVSAQGFSAEWSLLSLHRNFPQHWLDNDYRLLNSPVGVELLRPVDHYLKNHRAARYSFLVVSFAFLIFFIFEMVKKVKLHPMSYILVGLNLSLFFLILLALSEHIGFDKAYATGVIVHLGVLGIYASGLLQAKRLVLMLVGLMAFIFGYIFVLLQMEDYALLTGSIGLFVLLSVLMIWSRKVNWYGLQSGVVTSGPSRTPPETSDYEGNICPSPEE